MGLLLIIALTLASESGAGGGAAIPGPPAKIVVVAVAGKLSREEVSPGPSSPADVLRSVGSDGVVLERVTFTFPDQTRRVEALRTVLLPPGATAMALRHGEGGGLGAAPPAEAPPPRPVKQIHVRFGAPPPPDPEETEAVALLRRAAGGPDAPHRFLDGGSTLDAVRSARVALVVIDAASDAAGDVRRRGEAIRRILEAAGAGAHVIIACIPEDGPGSVLARGPLFRSGQAIAAEKPAGVVAAAVRRILEGEAPGKEPDGAADLFSPTR